MSTANLDLRSPGRSIFEFYAAAVRAPLPSGRIRVLSLPVQCPDPGRLLSLDRTQEGFLWRSQEGPWAAALGAAEVISVGGADRFGRLREQASELFRRIELESFEGDAEEVPLALYGGAAFHPGAADEEPWRDFGDCRFVLPRLAVTRPTAADPQTPSRLLVALGSLASRAPSALPLEDVVRHLSVAPPSRSFGGGSWSGERETGENPDGDEPSTAWIRQVEEIRQAIVDGRLAKVVAARRIEVGLEREVDPLALVELLEGRGSGCARFVVRRPGKAFAGATPERLIRRRGERVETHALAGSIDRRGGDDPRAASQLLDSAKDRLEHRLVVDHLVERLRPWCSSLSWDPEPTVRQLRSVLHLETEMEGVLDRPRHVLELVERLHPTPAVGGVPVAEAVGWAIANEAHPRGWYAGPVGWFDHRGDGDFAVALRSVLLDGRRALAHAGAGIVAESSPVAEFWETEIKLRSLRSALARVSHGELGLAERVSEAVADPGPAVTPPR